MGENSAVSLLSALGSVGAVLLTEALPVWGRDLDGRYRDSPLHDWFEHLASGKGLCCSFADGYIVEAADWETKDGHYRVRVPVATNADDAIWVDLPDEAVIAEPNEAARTIVWPLYGLGPVSIRCFMPVAMT